MKTAIELAEAYFDMWLAKDFDAFRALIADDATFVGALGTANGADEFVAGIKSMSRITKDVVVRKRIADDTDVITWFDLHSTVTEQPIPIANWTHVVGGLITEVRVTFDPRPLLPPS
ncbi:MAG: nuclear transport factor 2 family protein [Sciscionella sp.]|nr:nuclear transport factor 2 family protein [Sciscionella sp.]